MHKKFDSGEIETRWQNKWRETGLYTAGDRDASKEKEYILVEWPYPSGNLHIGHWYAFAVPDIYARFKRMNGKQVLYPMGFDAFGLPAENAAIKRGLDPKAWTNDNIVYMREQLERMGSSFTWDKTANSTDTNYYQWTQWMFTQFFEKGIAYRGRGIVNWCPGCNTVIANEQVLADDTCERSGDIIEKREMPQWMMKITDYADRLTDDLDALDWPEHIKEAQRQWIGRSRGAKINFKLNITKNNGHPMTVIDEQIVSVFTTRPDTLFGATYIVLAPEHPLVAQNAAQIANYDEVALYATTAKQKDEQDRLDATKEKTGVKLEGITATNPASGEEIPVYIADYVLAGYGTGAIMAVPAHDERDYVFATKFGLPIRHVVSPVFNQTTDIKHHRTGVYALITNNQGQFLMQHFTKRNFYWLPGGGIDAGENEIEALSREIKEETGYTNFTITEKVAEVFLDYVRNTDAGLINARNKTIVYNVSVHSDENQTLTFHPFHKSGQNASLPRLS